MTSDDLERRAADLGLEKLAQAHPADLERALANAKALAGRLPTDLHWTLEPAHTFSLAPRTATQPEDRS